MHLIAGNLLIRFPERGDEAALVHFHWRNREFFLPSGSVNPATDFESYRWTSYIRQSTSDRTKGTAVRFLVFDTEAEQPTLIAKISYTQIFRGPFHACYLGYAIDEAYTGRGLITQALGMTNDYMFGELNIHRIMANYMPENVASGRVLEKLGFVKEGLAKDYLRINGEWRDHVLTSLT
ncbi:MAG: GNAT family N-acetyltransferase, partial [candidate division Zixibacteria bacterium]|nr:GNAT family N-acetyltransferase [candidate division Zixibacteria bacterium]